MNLYISFTCVSFYFHSFYGCYSLLTVIQVTGTVLELYQAGFVDFQDTRKESSFETYSKSKSLLRSGTEKKKKRRSLREVSSNVPYSHVDNVDIEFPQTGYIMDSKNRFYEIEKKCKSKRLRI